MKIVFYCQHVLGIGHLFRTLEICKALQSHEVTLITGGPHVDVVFPEHIREFRLPEMQMDSEFKALFSAETTKGLYQIKEDRQKRLFEFFVKEQPDLFIMELYPFGRKAFRHELDPVLQAIREKSIAVRGVFSSVRDILVEKEDQERHELRALNTLNNYFDGVLVHSDPDWVRLNETFYHMDQIRVPVVYTGYIAPKPIHEARKKLRHKLGIQNNDKLLVASAGGGTIGAPLLESVIQAFFQINLRQSVYLYVFTGPYLNPGEFDRLKTMASRNVQVAQFSPDFLSYLAAADLSISMGGYNTVMNILATGVPALVWPFPQNQEQRMRAKQLEQKGLLRILDNVGMEPNPLASIMEQMMTEPVPPRISIDLEGADNTAVWLEQWVKRNGSSSAGTGRCSN